MQLSTRGEFGGLGIVISIRDGQLTVIRPMPGTPAARAGLKNKDRIVKIGEESTLNMPLDEAVSRLRGTPGSTVAVWIVREGAKGWQKPKRFDLMRAVIHIESVESRMLADGDRLRAREQLPGEHLRRPPGRARQAAQGRTCAASCSTCATTRAACSSRRCASPTCSCRAARSSPPRRTTRRSASASWRAARAPSRSTRSSCW